MLVFSPSTLSKVLCSSLKHTIPCGVCSRSFLQALIHNSLAGGSPFARPGPPSTSPSESHGTTGSRQI
ncbi:hypothetical protein FKP32DRAFT_1077333 [Trametes sanguinea]|nr:hypothetical protein FKP32DRAFT_1077333 [Trametes sanguinea]